MNGSLYKVNRTFVCITAITAKPDGNEEVDI